MYIAILGRQPALGIAELERLYGDVTWFTTETAIIKTDDFDLSRLGGTQKAGRILAEIDGGDWKKASQKIVQYFSQEFAGHEGKITLGISAFNFPISGREVQKTGIVLKSKLKASGVSLRLIPNGEPALNTATSHHNKLGLSDNKIELLVVRGRGGKIIVAMSVGAQNITAYARRDQGRPKRDAFVGMLPPKLAQMMINMAGPTDHARILDPFCGTGVILQEAALMGFDVYGTDLADKMIDYSETNLKWLADTHRTSPKVTLHQGDAMTTSWQPPIDAVICETYLGQPFSAPPSPAKLADVRKNCNHIITSFLKNLSTQIPAGTPLCIAVPAWRDTNGDFTHLPLIDQVTDFGYEHTSLKNIRDSELLYYREDQIVARELLIMIKK